MLPLVDTKSIQNISLFNQKTGVVSNKSNNLNRYAGQIK